MGTPETPQTPAAEPVTPVEPTPAAEPQAQPAPVEPAPVAQPVEPSPVATPAATPAATKPSGPSDSYHDLGMWARRNASAGLWEFGVTLDGADVVLFTRKLGGLDDDLREQFQPGFKAQRAEEYLRERLGF